MYDQDVVELALYALEEGMTHGEVAELVGVSRTAVCAWANGRIPHPRSAPRRTYAAPRTPPDKIESEIYALGMEGHMLGPSESERKLYEPPRSGPLAGLEPSQIENLLLRAVLADLKVESWNPALISNKSKCELGERLRLATGLPLRCIIGFLKISKSSYEYHRSRLGYDKYAQLRKEVHLIFEQGDARWGYRVIWARLRRSGIRVSEKVIRRIMREEDLRVVYNRRRKKGWSSYVGEVSAAPENLVNRKFCASEPDQIWLTDITEFHLPNRQKVYLSSIIDCYDGMPIAWRIGRRPSKGLANETLCDAAAQMRPGAQPTIHSDRGGHYRWPEWIEICNANGIVRSMSAKACTPDNAAMEGFFGRLKNEFFYYRDWRGVSAEEFSGRLDGYLRYYREGRIKKSLDWMSPMEYRKSKGYAV